VRKSVFYARRLFSELPNANRVTQVRLPCLLLTYTRAVHVYYITPPYVRKTRQCWVVEEGRLDIRWSSFRVGRANNRFAFLLSKIHAIRFQKM